MLSVGAEKNRKSGRAKFGRSAKKKKRKEKKMRKRKRKRKTRRKKKKEWEGKAFLPRSPLPPP